MADSERADGISTTFDADELTGVEVDASLPVSMVRGLTLAASTTDVIDTVVGWIPSLVPADRVTYAEGSTETSVTIRDDAVSGSRLTVPIRCETGSLGSITLTVAQPGAYDRRAAATVLAVADLAAAQMALRRRVAEAWDLALLDPLTGAANRRAFTTNGDDRLGMWHRDQTPFALGVIDLDRFKDVNDRFGHAAGDKLLKLVVETLQRQSRAGDVIARIGGEEFAVTIVDADRGVAVAVFERIRRTIEALRLPIGTEAVQITASIGVTIAGPDDTDVDDLFARADAALYEAKNTGRNRVAFHPPRVP